MKRILSVLILVATTIYAKEELYVEVIKMTNGSYIYSIPHYKKQTVNENMLEYESLDLLFTSNRGDIFTSPNHHSIKYSRGFGVIRDGIFMSFSLNLQYFLNGNDDKVDEGFRFSNTFRIGITGDE